MRRTACEKCGQDIEGTYREGWRDRGGNKRCCPTGRRDQDGLPLATPRGNHRPNDYRGCVIERNPINGMWRTFSSETGSLQADSFGGLKRLISHTLKVGRR
jgi:hypothetical protein